MARDRSRFPRRSGNRPRLDDEAFERLVELALDEIPEALGEFLSNVAVVVEDEPPPEVLDELGFEEGDELFGLYEGVPLTERDSFYQSLPDRIAIYRSPLERVCESRREIVREIRDTVVHEIGHHFGLSDEEMPY